MHLLLLGLVHTQKSVQEHKNSAVMGRWKEAEYSLEVRQAFRCWLAALESSSRALRAELLYVRLLQSGGGLQCCTDFFFFFDNFKVIHIKDLNKKQKKKAHLFLIVVKALAY